MSFVWANAAASGDAYREPFEKLFGLGANRGNNTNGIESYRNMAADDIQREVFNSSVSHNHDVTITGGTEKTKVLFALNYMDEQGMKINSYSKRAGASLKVNQKLADNVVVSLDARFSGIRNMGDEGTTNGSGSLLSSAYRFRPISTQHILGNLDALREGNVEQFGRASLWDAYSPVSKISDYEPLEINQNLRSTLSLEWELFKNLKYHTDLTYSNSWDQDKVWAGAVYNEYLDDSTGEKLYAGSVDYKKSDGWNLRWTNTTSYDFTLSKEHRLNLLVGHEVTDSGGSELRVKASHFPSNFTKDNAFAMINQYDKDHGTSSFSSNIDTTNRILSFFGRVNYSLLDRYLLTVTFRADGSSKFSPEHRWEYFPAAAFGWRLSEEAFMKDIDWLDNLKLRLSYGTVGNDGISSDLWSQIWTSETDLRWQYATGHNYWSSYDYATSEMANQDLKWETTITRNVGLDFGFFKNRLWGSVDLYWNTTKDLLMLTSIPGITGFTSIYANIGQTSNKGLELSLSGVLFENKDWSITAGMNINFNRGNVDELVDNVSGLYGTSWASSQTIRTDVPGLYGDLQFEQIGVEEYKCVYARRTDYLNYYRTAEVAFQNVFDNIGSAHLVTVDDRGYANNPFQRHFQYQHDLEISPESLFEIGNIQGGQSGQTTTSEYGYGFGRPSNGGSKNAAPCKCFAAIRILPTFYYGEYEEGDMRRDVSVAVTGMVTKQCCLSFLEVN